MWHYCSNRPKRGFKMFHYRVVLYKDNKVLPITFETWEKADDYIFKHKLHAFITVMEDNKNEF